MIGINWVPTKERIADLFTKPLDKTFLYLRTLLMSSGQTDGAVSVVVLPHGFGDMGHRRQNTLRAMYTTGECGREGMHGARGTRA